LGCEETRVEVKVKAEAKAKVEVKVRVVEVAFLFHKKAYFKRTLCELIYFWYRHSTKSIGNY